MNVRDTRKRKVLDAGGKSYVFFLRRMICSCCGSLHIELPDCIAPNKHYSKSTIENTISGKIDYCAADSSTIRRWKK